MQSWLNGLKFICLRHRIRITPSQLQEGVHYSLCEIGPSFHDYNNFDPLPITFDMLRSCWGYRPALLLLKEVPGLTRIEEYVQNPETGHALCFVCCLIPTLSCSWLRGM